MAMRRKVIKQGHNTLTITLPAKWVEKNNVKAGAELDIQDKDHILIITTKPTNGKETTTIDISEFDVALEKVIYSLYKKGYDEIVLNYSDSSVLNKIQKIILELVIGFEIVSHSKNSCTIRSVVEMDDNEFSSILRRTFLLLHSQEEGILNSLESEDYPSLIIFRNMESTNNRYTGFCRRVINKRGFGEQKNEKLLYCMIEFLEKAADEYKFLSDFLTENKNILKKLSKENLDLFRRVCLLSRSIEKLYYKFDIKDYLSIYRERKDIVKVIAKNYPMEKSPNSIFLHYMLSLVGIYIDITNFILTMKL